MLRIKGGVCMSMLQLAIVLIIIGAVLICAEAFLPGFGVCGISGLIAFIGGIVLTIISSPIGLFIALGELGVLALLIFTAIRYIKRKQLHGKLILDSVADLEPPEHGDLSYFMGKEGVTKTTLRPYGKVDFNGTGVEASADGQYIPENVRVKVIDVSGRKVTVKPLQTNN